MIIPDSSCEHHEEWLRELEKFCDVDGIAAQTTPANFPNLFMVLLLKQSSHIQTIRIGIEFWNICCRMNQFYGAERIKVRVALAKADITGPLTLDHFEERICEFNGSADSEPNGHFCWNHQRSKLPFKDGHLPAQIS